MDSTNFYFIEEFIEGKELLDYIQDVEITEGSIIELLKKLIKASMYILNNEFQFYDLKPHNIFVQPDGVVKITDFEYKTTFDNK